MGIEVVEGTSQKPAASGELVNVLRNRADLQGQLFIGYPIVPTFEGPHAIDALLVSEDKGIVVFDLVEGHDAGDYVFRQDDSANKIEARLKLHPRLLYRRKIKIPVHTMSFAPRITNADSMADDSLATRQTVVDMLKDLTWEDSDPAVCKTALSTIESISAIRQSRTRRKVMSSESRGARLKALEASIATLDNPQSKAVIETVEGIQRIRGLAGSGKTIVLALKAAYLHAQHPEWHIAVTFNTRSLKGQFRRLINSFTLEQTNQEPDWENLRIINAWGAPGGKERDGIYHQFCRVNGVEYFDFRAAQSRFGRDNSFSHACDAALSEARKCEPVYDAILIDEAQDFSPSFLRLCHRLLREPRRLVYAYDELQNLSGGSLPPPEEIFTDDEGFTGGFSGTANRVGPREDIILQKCYRNSRPVLVTAHALGFGIYRDSPVGQSSGLIQMFDNAELWTEVGYNLRQGRLRDGNEVVLERTSETSPRFLEDHSPLDDLIQFRAFGSLDEQTEWIVQAIRENLENDELRCDDIVVINPDPVTTRKRVGPVRRRLFELGIDSHLAGVDTDADTFFRSEQDSVTFTGIYRAKGNEAGMVYIINAQDCHSSAWNLASIRNRLFTAMTRSKAWIRVLGVGEGMQELIREYERLRDRQFELQFAYPDAQQRQHLRMVHRDMTAEERRRLERGQRTLADLVSDLRAGTVNREDLDKGVLEELRRLLH